MPTEDRKVGPLGAPGTRDTDLIPDSLVDKAPATWRRADVLTFLQHNQDRCGLGDEDIAIFKRECIGGSTLIGLTREILLGVHFKMKFGPADQIAQMIEILNPTGMFLFTLCKVC